MKRVVIVNGERRDWKRKNVVAEPERRRNPQRVTRRYVLLVDDPQVRGFFQKEFEMMPHESGNEFVFYCIAQPSYRRAREFADTISYKLKKNHRDDFPLESIEILPS